MLFLNGNTQNKNMTIHSLPAEWNHFWADLAIHNSAAAWNGLIVLGITWNKLAHALGIFVQFPVNFFLERGKILKIAMFVLKSYFLMFSPSFLLKCGTTSLINQKEIVLNFSIAKILTFYF